MLTLLHFCLLPSHMMHDRCTPMKTDAYNAWPMHRDEWLLRRDQNANIIEFHKLSSNNELFKFAVPYTCRNRVNKSYCSKFLLGLPNNINLCSCEIYCFTVLLCVRQAVLARERAPTKRNLCPGPSGDEPLWTNTLMWPAALSATTLHRGPPHWQTLANIDYNGAFSKRHVIQKQNIYMSIYTYGRYVRSTMGTVGWTNID